VNPDLIAPCGMNGRPCRAYGRENNPCRGCHGVDDLKSKSAVSCRIRNCEPIKAGIVRYCFECQQYPCSALNHLDNRYTTKYGMSVIDNLEKMKHAGMERFIGQEKERWACPQCGEIICVPNVACADCGHTWG